MLPQGMFSESELLQHGFQQLGITSEASNSNVARIRSVASRFVTEFRQDKIDFARTFYKLYPEGGAHRLVNINRYAGLLRERYHIAGDPKDLAEISVLEQKLKVLWETITPIMNGLDPDHFASVYPHFQKLKGTPNSAHVGPGHLTPRSNMAPWGDSQAVPTPNAVRPVCKVEPEYFDKYAIRPWTLVQLPGCSLG